MVIESKRRYNKNVEIHKKVGDLKAVLVNLQGIGSIYFNEWKKVVSGLWILDADCSLEKGFQFSLSDCKKIQIVDPKEQPDPEVLLQHIETHLKKASYMKFHKIIVL